MKLRSMWALEFSELAGMYKRDIEKVKSFTEYRELVLPQSSHQRTAIDSSTIAQSERAVGQRLPPLPTND
jgi:hypothetical protein